MYFNLLYEVKIMDENKKSNKFNSETAKILSDFGKEVLKFGKSSDENSKADQKSTSEFNNSLADTLISINKEIENCTDPDLKNSLYKQREDLLNRLEKEKENQRQYNSNREDKDRTQAKGIFATVAFVALGAGSVALKLLIDNKKS